MTATFVPLNLYQHATCWQCRHVFQTTLPLEQCAACGHAKTVDRACAACWIAEVARE